MSDIGHRLGLWTRISTPGVTTALFILLSAVDFRIVGFEDFFPKISLIAIFYWTIYRASLMPAWLVFALGIFEDFVFGTPFGISSLINLLFWKTTKTQKKYFLRENFWVVWAVFGFASLIFSLIAYIIYSFYYGQFIISDQIFMQWIFSSLAYPILHKIFDGIHSKMIKVN